MNYGADRPKLCDSSVHCLCVWEDAVFLAPDVSYDTPDVRCGCDPSHYAGPVEMFDERAEIGRLRDRLYEVEQRVAWLLELAGRAEEVTPLDDAVRETLHVRTYIDAVMLYRERTGAGLAEAKQYVDRLRSRGEIDNDDESVAIAEDDLSAAELTDVPGATEAGSVTDDDLTVEPGARS